jgi:hypothetical protein
MQSGMLFPAQRGGAPGVDVEQVMARLPEPLDEEHFVPSWERVVVRHPILRTRFRWRDAKRRCRKFSSARH